MTQALSIVGASRNNGERSIGDFYPTPPYAVDELLKRETFEGEIWECACGKGDISETLFKNGYLNVYSSDLFNRGYGESIKDFLISDRKTDNIVTNPPYKYALEFVLNAKRLASKKIAMLMKTVFLESAKRKPMFEDKEFPLKSMYQFSKRLEITKDGLPMKNSGLIAYAWFVWDREYSGKPQIEWI